MIVNAGETVT